MEDLLDDDFEFDEVDESDHSFKRKRPTEASWDSDDELLQEDHVPAKKSRGQSLTQIDEDALLGDSDDDNVQGEILDEDQTDGLAPPASEDYEAGGDTQLEEEEELPETGGDYEAGQKEEQSFNYTGQLDDAPGNDWAEPQADEGGDDYREEYFEADAGEGGATYEEGCKEAYGEGDGFEGVGGDTYEGGGEPYEGNVYEDEAALNEPIRDEDDAILEDAIQLEPDMDDLLDIEDVDESFIEEADEGGLARGSGTKPSTSTPSAPGREKPVREIREVSEQQSQSYHQMRSQPTKDEDEEGSDSKEDIPSSDDDEEEDDDTTTRTRFKSERRPVTVKVGGASKRKDIPETLEITAEIQQTVDEFARQKEEQSHWKRRGGRGGRGYRGNRGNRHHGPQQHPLMLGMRMRHPASGGPRFPGDMGHGFPHAAPPGAGFHPHEEAVVRGPPAGHFRGGRFDFEPYKPDQEQPSRIPSLITQGPEQSSSDQQPSGAQGAVPSSNQAPPAQHTSQSGTPAISQAPAPKSKTIHINPHFKGQVQVPSQQGGPTPQPHHAPSSATPPLSQYQPPSTGPNQRPPYQPPESYPQSSAHSYPPSSQQQPPPGRFQQSQPPPPQGHSQSQPPTHMQTHPQGPPSLMGRPPSAEYPEHQQQHFGPQRSEPWSHPASHHPNQASWTQSRRPDPVSVTWSHQPRPDFQGQSRHQPPPARYNGPQSTHEHFPHPHHPYQGPRPAQPRGMQQQQQLREPLSHHQRPGYRQQDPPPNRQGGPRQPFQNPNQRPSARQPSPRQPSPRQPSPQQPSSQQPSPQQAAGGSNPSALNPVHKGRILPSPKRLIEEASKKGSKVAAAKPPQGQIDEDAETKRLRIQMGEQKKLRELILQRKEARRQQLAASKQAELKKRMAAQKQKSQAEGDGSQAPPKVPSQPQQPPPQQRQPPPANHGVGMPGPRQPSPQSTNRNSAQGAANRALLTNQQQQQQPRQTPAMRGASPQPWAGGGPRQPRPGAQPRPQGAMQRESAAVRAPGMPGQQFQQQAWQQQQNVKVLVAMEPQPIPTLGGGGSIVPPQRPIGVVSRTGPGQVRGQQRPPGPQSNMGRGRGRGRGQPNPTQFQQQQLQQRPQGFQPQQQQQQQAAGFQQGTGPRPQPGGGRGRGRGQAASQPTGPRMAGPRPQGVHPQAPGVTSDPQQGQIRPQRRSVKDRIGIPLRGTGGQAIQAPVPQAQQQRRVVEQNQARPQPTQPTGTTNRRSLPANADQAGGQQRPNNRTVVQQLTPQQRQRQQQLQQQQQRRAVQVAATPPGGAVHPPRIQPPPQPQRVVQRASADAPEVSIHGPTGVIIDGLSASTNRSSLIKMLQTCGPIKNLEVIPSHRRAIVKFCLPKDARAFQARYHRHMIDLAHISVSLDVE